MAYVPPRPVMSRDDWPTLGEMIESGKRVVIFMDKGADEPVVNFILPQFKMVRPLALPLSLPTVFVRLTSALSPISSGKINSIRQTASSPAKSIEPQALLHRASSSA